jgi:hypothetical protein
MLRPGIVVAEDQIFEAAAMEHVAVENVGEVLPLQLSEPQWRILLDGVDLGEARRRASAEQFGPRDGDIGQALQGCDFRPVEWCAAASPTGAEFKTMICDVWHAILLAAPVGVARKRWGVSARRR